MTLGAIRSRRFHAKHPEWRKGKAEQYKAVSLRRKLKRQAWLNIYKHAAGCADCGYRAHVEALDFDHIPERGAKVLNLSDAWTVRWETLEAEIKKCEVVCSNCHRVRTLARLGV